MAITAPWIGTSVSGSGGGTSVLMDATGAPDGEWVFVAILIADSQVSAPTAPAGWTIPPGGQGQEGASGSPSSCLTIYQRLKQPGDTTTTFTWPTTRKFAAIIWSWMGLDKNTPLEGVTYLAHSAASVNYVTNAVAPTQADRWVGMVAGARGTVANQTFTPDGALTERIDFNHGGTTPFTAIELADSNAVVSTASATYTAVCSQADPNGGTIAFALIPEVATAAVPPVVMPPPLLFALVGGNQAMWQQGAPAAPTTPEGGTGALGLTGTGVAVHVAPMTGRAALGLTGTGADRKTAPDTGRGAVGFTGRGAPGEIIAQTGRGAIGLTGTGSQAIPAPAAGEFTETPSRWARVLTTEPHDPTLDLDLCIGQRQATFRFDLVNGVTGMQLGRVYPMADTAPTLTHDTTRTVKRTVAFAFDATDTAAINTLTDRVLVSMLIAGRTFPLGRYMFTDQSRVRSTGGIQSADQLVDEMFLVDQKISAGFAVTTGTVPDTLQDLLTPLPVSVVIDASPYAAVGGWGIGTNRGQILDALTTQGDYFPSWFDNDGIMRFIRTVDPAQAVPTFDFDSNNKVVANSIVESDDSLTAPNRYIVVSNATDANAAPVVGLYDVPPSAPYSIQSRGFILPDVRNIQLNGQAQATAAARQIGIKSAVFTRTELQTPPDPRHDSYDVILWQGDKWLEIAWTMELAEGGNMSHVMRRAYT